MWGLGFRVWGLGFGVWGLGLGFGVWGLGFGVWDLGGSIPRYGVASEHSEPLEVQGDLGLVWGQYIGFGIPVQDAVELDRDTRVFLGGKWLRF